MMETNDLVYSAVLRDFQEARRRAGLEDLKARLTGKSDDLLSYEAVHDLLQAEGSVSRGLQDIPLDAIVGSVGRHHDFTRSFLPRRESDQHRWANVKLKAIYQGGFPPIEVYQLGANYFVLDGNHRVSVSRQLGADTIQAYVTEVHSRVPLSLEVEPAELIIKARYAQFLDYTSLDKTRPGLDLLVTAPGQYRRLEEQVEARRRLLAQRQGREVGLAEAAAAWYDDVYQPVIQIVRDRDLLSGFPGYSETDLFLWVSERQEDVEEEIGWTVRPERVAGELANGRSRRKRASDVQESASLRDGAGAPSQFDPLPLDPASERLFPDILVPISGTERGWLALEQALLVAQREGSALHGFHVVRSDSQGGAQRAQGVQDEFDRRCQAAGVRGATGGRGRAGGAHHLPAGALDRPGGGQPGLSTGSQGWPASSSRAFAPWCIAVAGRCWPCRRSRRSAGRCWPSTAARARARRLHVATYLAARWRIPLAVVTVMEPSRASAGTLDVARDYIAAHGLAGAHLEAHG